MTHTASIFLPRPEVFHPDDLLQMADRRRTWAAALLEEAALDQDLRPMRAEEARLIARKLNADADSFEGRAARALESVTTAGIIGARNLERKSRARHNASGAGVGC